MLYIGLEDPNDTHVLRPLTDELDRRGTPYRVFPPGHWKDDTLRLEVERMGKGDVLVVANHEWSKYLYEEQRGELFIVWTMHEFISSKRSMGKNLDLFDAVCVPCDYVEEYLRSKAEGLLPEEVEVWGTGYVQLDTLYKGLRPPPPGKLPPTVLVCPTYNPVFSGGLSWFQNVGIGVYFQVLIKAHEQAMGMAVLGAGYVSPELDLMEVLPKGDIHVADLGSAMFLQLMTGKPCFVYDSYRWWEEDRNFDPHDGGFDLRDAFYTFSSGEQFDMLVRAVLSGEDPLWSKRQELMTRLVTYKGLRTFDGRVARRIADRLEERMK